MVRPQPRRRRPRLLPHGNLRQRRGPPGAVHGGGRVGGLRARRLVCPGRDRGGPVGARHGGGRRRVLRHRHSRHARGAGERPLRLPLAGSDRPLPALSLLHRRADARPAPLPLRRALPARLSLLGGPGGVPSRENGARMGSRLSRHLQPGSPGPVARVASQARAPHEAPRLRHRRAAIPAFHPLARERAAHPASAPGRAPRLLQRPAFHAQRHARGDDPRGAFPQRAALRGGGVRHAGRERSLGGAGELF